MKSQLKISKFTILFIFIFKFSFGQNDTQEITAVVNNFIIYSYTNQMDKFGNLFTPNATFVDVTGTMAEGSANIKDLFAMGKYIYDSSTTPIYKNPHIQFINPNFAIAHSIWSGLVFKSKGKPLKVRSGYASFLLEKIDGKWKIVQGNEAYDFLNQENFDFVEYNHKMWKDFGVEENLIPDEIVTAKPIYVNEQNDTLAIKTIGLGLSQYFYGQNLEKFAGLFGPNATFITVTGIKANGRDLIVDAHAIGKHIIDKISKVKLKTPLVRFVNKNIAVAYCVWDGLAFHEDVKRGIVQSGYLSVILEKQGKIWQVLSACNAYNFRNRKDFDLIPYSHDVIWKQYGIKE